MVDYGVVDLSRGWCGRVCCYRKVQVGKDQEKAQSEKDYHSKNRGGKKKQQTNNQVLTP